MTRNEVVKIVSQKLRTTLSTMSVEYCEELNLELWLLVAVWLDAWLFEIKNNRYSIFVVVTDKAVVSVCSVCDHV